MSKKFRWFLLSISTVLDSGDEWAVLDFLGDFNLREELENSLEFEVFFDNFDEFVDTKQQLKFLEREVKRLS